LISKRANILWLGAKAEEPIESALNNLGLQLSYIGEARSISKKVFANSSALVINISEEKAGLFHTRFESIVISALDHGLIVLIGCAITIQRPIDYKIGAAKLDKKRIVVVIKDKNFQNKLVNLIICQLIKSGPAYNNNCEILPKNIKLKMHQRVFLKRAFSDCKEITLQKLSEGKSASVFCVYAVAGEGRHSPFFAKFDELVKIQEEHNHYKNDVLTFIPFNLRPNLIEDRCVEGANFGLLVGDFVEHSESLWEVVRRGDCKSALNSLFENTLSSWRIPLNKVDSPNKLFKAIDLKELDEDRRDLLEKRSILAKEFHQHIPPDLLIKTLNDLPAVNYHTVRVHGDLHAENVRVRNNESILIDFFSVDWGPSSRDPAALEIWIAFAEWPKKVSFSNWRKLIDELYDLSSETIQLPKIKHQSQISSAIWNCIRQIRGFAFAEQIEQHEYQISLAYWLYKHSTRAVRGERKTDKDDDDKRRAYAYYLSNKLATETVNILNMRKC
jgi:hypothetical protein